MNLYHLMSSLSQPCERTYCKLKTKGLNQPRQCTHITKWYQTCTECLDASHQYKLQSKQIQSLCQMYSNSISTAKDCGRSGERNYNLLRQGCEKRHRSSAHSVWKVSTNVTPSYLNDLKSKNSLLDTEDVDTCLNK